MPIGMPGCPDLAASTASMASTRMELASSASETLATGESIGRAQIILSAMSELPPSAARELPFSKPAGYEHLCFCDQPGEGHWFVFRGDQLLVEMGPLERPSDDPRVRA